MIFLNNVLLDYTIITYNESGLSSFTNKLPAYQGKC